MSLTCTCNVCGNSSGWYRGFKDGVQETDNLYIVGRLTGDQGCTYDDTKVKYVHYICGGCLEKILPQVKTSIEKLMVKEERQESN